MTSTQKLIKYCALAFAAFLIAIIIGGIARAVLGIGEAIFGESAKMDKYVYLVEESNLSKLDSPKLIIETKATNIKIIKGGTFSVQTNNKNINYYPGDEEIKIKDKSKNGFNLGSVSTELIIEIPKAHTFDKISIESGAGKININEVEIPKLEIELGSGSLTIDDTIVNKVTEIEGGAGSITINNSKMSNLDLEIGTGSFKYSGDILGTSNIESGIGSTTINLTGKKEDYQFRLEKGAGSITVDGEKVSDDGVIGDGENRISIEGGIGSITINYEK